MGNKITSWKNEPNVLQLQQDLEIARGPQATQISKIDHWNTLMEAPKIINKGVDSGRSTVQPKLIRKQAEWRYAALTEPLLSSSKMFNVTPVTFEDKDSAEQNELILNWQIRTKLNRVKLVDDIIRSVVDDGTCILRTGWCRTTKEVNEEVPVFSFKPIQDQASMEALQQAMQYEQSNPRGYNEGVPIELKEAVNFLKETGQPAIAIQTGTTNSKVEKVVDNSPTIEVVNPRNVFIDPSCNGDLSKALFVIHSFETNKAELLKEPLKYNNIKEIELNSNSLLNTSTHSSTTPQGMQFKDDLRKKLVAYEYWGYYDINDTGILEPIVVTWIGTTIIRMDINPYPDNKVPFVIIPYLPIKRSIYGSTDAELLEDNQRILGAVTRGVVDLLGRSANSQQGFAKGVLDPINKKLFNRGEDYEYNPSNGVPYIEHKYPEIPNSAMVMLNLQNQEAEALTGVKAFSGGISGSAYGDVAAGIRGALDASSKREMAILRRIAKGITDVGIKLLAMNSVFLSDTEVVRITNSKFITINREDLAGNFDLNVDISTAEIDAAKAQDLSYMLQTIGPNTDQSIMLMVLSEIADLKKMPELSDRIKNFKPEPNPIQQELQQLELEKAKREIAVLESQIAYNNARTAHEDTMRTQLELNVHEQVTGVSHAKELDRQEAQSRGNQNLAITKALVTPTKAEYNQPNIEAALGFNELTKNKSKDSLNSFNQPQPLQENINE